MATKKAKKSVEFKEETPSSFDGLKTEEQIQNTPPPASGFILDECNMWTEVGEIKSAPSKLTAKEIFDSIKEEDELPKTDAVDLPAWVQDAAANPVEIKDRNEGVTVSGLNIDKVFDNANKKAQEMIDKMVDENIIVSSATVSISGGILPDPSIPTANVVTIAESATSPSKLAIEDAVAQLTNWFENGVTRGQIIELRHKLKSV